MKRYAIFASLLAIAPAAHAQQRDVPFYIMHTAERQATQHRCAASQMTDDCLAAFKASDYIHLGEAQQRLSASTTGAGSDKAFFDQFPLARLTTLQECAHPSGAAYGPSPQTCQAARISAGK